jgi:hypothetical protein
LELSDQGGFTAYLFGDRAPIVDWIGKNLPETVFEAPERSTQLYVRFGSDDEEMLFIMRWPTVPHAYLNVRYGTDIDDNTMMFFLAEPVDVNYRISARLDARMSRLVSRFVPSRSHHDSNND